MLIAARFYIHPGDDMKKLLLSLSVLLVSSLSAQTFQLNLDSYKSFLAANKNITYSQLCEFE